LTAKTVGHSLGNTFVRLLLKTNTLRIARQALALGLAVAFGLASSACIAESALASVHLGSKTARHHHSEAEHGHPHGDHSPDCCASLKSVVPSAPHANLLPDQHAGHSVVVVAEIPLPVNVAMTAGFVYDHGPPVESLSAFLLVRSVSPRSPPASA
jgi:hypothetical protein